MRTTGYLLYKCRLCGQTFRGAHTPDIRITLMYLLEQLHPAMVPKWMKTGVPISATEFHHDCPAGFMGIGDIAGGEPTAEVEEAE